MSNSLSIAAVTATLRNLLTKGLQSEIPNPQNITTKPLDKARVENSTAKQVNIFLYQTQPNAALRNLDMPGSKPGETAQPPLAINLYYLITAYGADDDDVGGHQVLGKAMSILHDHTVLGREEIKNALPQNDLHQQAERIRISQVPISVDELSKLWNTFQTQYRISAAYEVTVVLIESNRPAKAPLPVLTRGKDDSGVAAQGNLVPPFPTIESLTLPNLQTTAQPGDAITLTGHHLDGNQIFIRLTNHQFVNSADPNADGFKELAPVAGATDTSISFVFPDVPNQWPAGFYRVSVRLVRTPNETLVSNEIGLPVAPAITSVLQTPATGGADLTLGCKPQVLPTQRASLLVDDQEILAEPHPAATASLKFRNARQGTHFLRLRVDGIDSILVDRSVRPPVFFDTDKHKVTIP